MEIHNEHNAVEIIRDLKDFMSVARKTKITVEFDQNAAEEYYLALQQIINMHEIRDDCGSFHEEYGAKTI